MAPPPVHFTHPSSLWTNILSIHEASSTSAPIFITIPALAELPRTTTFMTSTISHTVTSTTLSSSTTTSTTTSTHKLHDSTGLSSTKIAYITIAITGFLFCLAITFRYLCHQTRERRQRSAGSAQQIGVGLSLTPASPYNLRYNPVNHGNTGQRESRAWIGAGGTRAYNEPSETAREKRRPHQMRRRERAEATNGWGKWCLSCGMGKWFNSEKRPRHLAQEETRKDRETFTQNARRDSEGGNEYPLQSMSSRNGSRSGSERGRRNGMETPLPTYQVGRSYEREAVWLSYEYLGERRYFGGF